jgi:hypothetical protein
MNPENENQLNEHLKFLNHKQHIKMLHHFHAFDKQILEEKKEYSLEIFYFKENNYRIINHKFVVEKKKVNLNNLLLFLIIEEYFLKLFLIHNNLFVLIQYVLIIKKFFNI